MQRTRTFDLAEKSPEYFHSLQGQIVHVPTTLDDEYVGTLHWRVSDVRIDGAKCSVVFTDVELSDFSEAELAIAQRVAAEHAREASAG